MENRSYIGKSQYVIAKKTDFPPRYTKLYVKKKMFNRKTPNIYGRFAFCGICADVWRQLAIAIYGSEAAILHIN